MRTIDCYRMIDDSESIRATLSVDSPPVRVRNEWRVARAPAVRGFGGEMCSKTHVSRLAN